MPATLPGVVIPTDPVTLPVPVPFLLTAARYVVGATRGARSNVAEMLLSESMLTVQVAGSTPAMQPTHEVNTQSGAGVAVSVTSVAGVVAE
jgi:hypothetical protein